MRNKILTYINENSNRRLRKVTLRRALCHTQEEKDDFKHSLRALFSDGTLIKEKGGHVKIVKPEAAGVKAEFVEGKITVKEGAFGFVDIQDSQESLFIPPGKTGGALSGDIVKVLITDRSNPRGPVGVVKEIVESTYTHLFGQLVFEGSKVFARPLRPGTPDIFLDAAQVEEVPDLQAGDWVKVEITERNLKRSSIKGLVICKTGDAGDLDAELDAVISEYDLQPLYTPDEEKLAARLKERPISRRDLRGEVIMTVDPIDAKDFDDALSVHEHDDPKIITIGVHIADVAAYISPNGVWQKRIRDRCFTAYLPGRMMPMLPKVLVSKRCSLNEDEEKPAHTVLLHINRRSGKVQSFERFHSTIKVRKRLNYEEVQEFADGDFVHKEWGEEIKGPVKELYQLSQKMRSYRRRVEKFIPLEAPEVRVMCDHRTMELTGLKHEVAREANQMVEEYMLAANVAVAMELSNRQLPGLYRVHPEPDPEAIEEFSAQAASVYELNTGDLSMRTNAVNFLNSIADLPESEVISFDFLRMMQRALYSETAALHYGLGKGLYSHFTSPIRRMSDLIVHQQLWEQESGRKILSRKACEQEAENITAKESVIDDAYRAASHRFKLYFIQQEMEKGNYKQVDAYISKIGGSSIKVFIQEFGMYCSMRLNEFDDDYYSVDGLGRFITGRKLGKVYNCGDRIKVCIKQINFARRELILTPVLSAKVTHSPSHEVEAEKPQKKIASVTKKKKRTEPKKTNRSSKAAAQSGETVKSADEKEISGFYDDLKVKKKKGKGKKSDKPKVKVKKPSAKAKKKKQQSEENSKKK